MNWNQVFKNLRKMKGMRLHSISGRSNIQLLDVDRDQVTISTTRGQRKRPTEELRTIVRKMDVLSPVHVDSVLLGSRSSRNQPETILANIPDVEWLRLNRCKHIVWVGRETHKIGTIMELDAFNIGQLAARYKGRGPLSGRPPTRLLIAATNMRSACEFVRALLQAPEPQPMPEGKGYVVTTEVGEILLVPLQSGSGSDLEIIPVIKVADLEETLSRIREVFPETVADRVKLGISLAVVRFPSGGSLALEE